MTKKCPSCGSTKYNSTKEGSFCRNCGFRNNPNYLKEKGEKLTWKNN